MPPAKPKELYWPFECERGHSFDYGPIHNPDAVVTDEESGAMSTDPAAKAEKFVPSETRGCPKCAEEMPLAEAADVVARSVKGAEAVYRPVDG